MGGIPNNAPLSEDAIFVSARIKYQRWWEKIVNNADICCFDGIGSDGSIPAQLVSYPADLDLMVTQKSALPLGEVGYGLVHQALWCELLVEGDLHPEVPAEKKLEHPPFGGRVSMPFHWPLYESII